MKDITFVNGTCYKTKRPEEIYDAVFLPDYEQVRSEKQIYAESFCGAIPQYGSVFRKKAGGTVFGTCVCRAESARAKPLTQQEMDDVYASAVLQDMASDV